MKRHSVLVIDIVGRMRSANLFQRFMRYNGAGLMPQVVAVWCKELGCEVDMTWVAGDEVLVPMQHDRYDVVLIAAFSLHAPVAYAWSEYFRQRGAVTVLGGPHARSYPEDAVKYFDYVLGLTDKPLIRDVLEDAQPHRPEGLSWSAAAHPKAFPTLRDRWPFLSRLRAASRVSSVIPMMSSVGCPYTCSFCIDSTIPYQPLDRGALQEDLSFLETLDGRPIVAWADPNFGVRFNEIMETIESARRSSKLRFIAESSLSLLSEPNVKRLRANNFMGLFPGVESWFTLAGKSKTGKAVGVDKVEKVAAHSNFLLSHIPFLQTNHVFGLDIDEGSTPFDLMKLYVDKAPGAFTAYSTMTAYGRNTPENLELQRQGRVIALPFYFANNLISNVRLKNYDLVDYYKQLLDVINYSFSLRNVARRFGATRGWQSRTMNLVRGLQTDRIYRGGLIRDLIQRLEHDRETRDLFEGETNAVPQVYIERCNKQLGALAAFLPAGALQHDPNAFLNATKAEPAIQKVAS